ncbi:hypothetical protein PM022_11510 [Halorubrum ezzemoulense]|uniref:hypothetical protein n=1 Tax=Halorubrum ezzemoulense TaxID=337243 RepID=UPI00232FCB8B|nr:hypothetical protein [Halorubrum ezzemoulense]MDB2275161.1 hypothetical protein [Halorubrum ezzemoulense]
MSPVVACGNRGRPTIQRRKFLVGVGSLAAGGAAATGTGAFTSATLADRSVSVSVNDDASSQIALVANPNLPDITQQNGELNLDLSGDSGEGANIDSRYSWGDPSDLSANWAFRITNNDQSGQDYAAKATYEFNGSNRDSVDDGNESFIKFTMNNDFGDPISQPFPDQGGNGARNNDAPLTGPGSYNGSDIAENRKLESGETWYFAVTVDTTGADADQSDNLSGSLKFELDESAANI